MKKQLCSFSLLIITTIIHLTIANPTDAITKDESPEEIFYSEPRGIYENS